MNEHETWFRWMLHRAICVNAWQQEYKDRVGWIVIETDDHYVHTWILVENRDYIHHYSLRRDQWLGESVVYDGDMPIKRFGNWRLFYDFMALAMEHPACLT